jgi:predicted membrane protein
MKTGAFYMIKKYLALWLIAIVGLLTLNNALFMHLHRLADGTLIVHAHPFDKSNPENTSSNSHQHTKLELLFFDSLLILFILGLLQITIKNTGSNITRIRSFNYLIRQNSPQVITNKAPPVFAIN